MCGHCCPEPSCCSTQKDDAETEKLPVRGKEASSRPAFLMAVLESLLLVLALTLVFRLLASYLHYRRLELAISGPPSLPVIGNLLSFVGSTPDNVLATILGLWRGRHDELWRIGVLGQMGIFVTNPDHLQKLFTTKDFVNKSRFVYQFFNAIGGQGLVALNGAKWRAHRRAFQPAFHQSLLDRYGVCCHSYLLPLQSLTRCQVAEFSLRRHSLLSPTNTRTRHNNLCALQLHKLV